jgi:hypothetical protein
MLQIGQRAREFKLYGVLRDRVGEYSLQSLKGNWLVLFFYPADFSFICPTEVVGFGKPNVSAGPERFSSTSLEGEEKGEGGLSLTFNC